MAQVEITGNQMIVTITKQETGDWIADFAALQAEINRVQDSCTMVLIGTGHQGNMYTYRAVSQAEFLAMIAGASFSSDEIKAMATA